jgi:hypothetical protein
VRLALLALVAALLPAAGPGPAPPGAARAGALLHDVHISHTRLVIEGTTIAGRVRVFHDDLQLALRALAGDSTLLVTAEDRVDRLFQRYAAAQLRLEADGRPVRLAVTASGTERDPTGQEVVWYVLEGTVERPVSRLVMRQGLFFDMYRDQQNIVQLLRMPGEERRTLYFTAMAPRDQVVEF